MALAHMAAGQTGSQLFIDDETADGSIRMNSHIQPNIVKLTGNPKQTLNTQ